MVMLRLISVEEMAIVTVNIRSRRWLLLQVYTVDKNEIGKRQ
jgi:hypothetical protein